MRSSEPGAAFSMMSSSMVDRVVDPLQDRERGVHDRVHDQVREKGRLPLGQIRALGDTFLNHGQRGSRLLVDADQKGRPDAPEGLTVRGLVLHAVGLEGTTEVVLW